MSSLNNQDSHSQHGHGNGHGPAASSRTTSTTTTGGLLLLSTKKSVMNSIGNASSNVNVKRISTHDALMNALNGDSGDRAKEKVPLAWGLKAPSVGVDGGGGNVGNVGSGVSANVATAASVSASTVAATPVNVAAASTATATATTTTTTTGTYTIASNTGKTGHGEIKEHNMVHDGSGDQSNYAKVKAISTPAAALPNSNSNDNTSSNDNSNDNTSSNSNAPNMVLNQDANQNSNHNPNNNKNPTSEMKKEQDPPAENQVDFMKKLAKERAEKRRLEEEDRVFQQKERAQQRLLALELKLQKKPPSFDNHNVVVAPSHDRSHSHDHSPNVNPNVNPNDKTNTNTNVPPKPITIITARHNVTPQEPVSRFSDPSRSYSSLLGGGAGAGAAQSHSQESNTATGTSTGATSSGYVIQLNNYDDRDRGGRSAGAGPRMLFDHKSGSMVKVPVGGSNSSSKEKKSSKKKLSPRNDRDKDKDVMHVNDRGNDRGIDRGNEEYGFQESGSANGMMEEDEDDDGEGGISRRSARYRQRAAKRSAKKDDKSLSVKPRKASMGKHESTSVKVGRVLPRTCGVLYKRDANGQFVSVDGCEGDQGYGAHSVVGGRLRNSKAYGSLRQKGRASGKQEKNSSTVVFPSNPSTDAFDTPAYLGQHAHSHPGLSSSNADYDYNRTLNRSHFMRKSQQPMADTYVDISVEVPFSVSHVVTGDERFDLLSGLDTSPKLQATAAAWAPSDAVLALAAANSQKTDSDRLSPHPQESDSDSDEEISESEYHAMNAMALIDNESGHDDEECQLEASPSIGLGLGFDPSQNMDSLMMSPAMEDETPLDVPGLSNFDFKESATALPKSSSSSFLGTTSILGSSTWGTSAAGNLNTMGSLSNWDLLGRAEDDVQKKQSPSAFLSLGQRTWGSGTANAFNGFNIDSPLESSD